ncbi:MAG: hypothetical protein KJO79_08375 [Verrucomicrobiae bacterium]|nr:hypothetical protein [Verrucomicrobiae bacterium]NNJ87182.1 hypothetical protein [Akkermansiaceae bacterium]
MKTKNCISIGALLAVSATMVHADLTFTAPGMSTPYVTTQLQKHKHSELGNYWKYIITGYDYRLNAGVPNGGKVAGNTLRYKTGNRTFPGHTTIKSKIEGQSILQGSLNTTSIAGTTGLVSHTFSSPIIIEDENITTCFEYETNMIGSNDYVIIYGSALTAPPVPIGSLVAPSYVRDGGRPTLQWFCTKSLSNDVVTVVIPPETENEAPNSGPVKSNNGHGNNIDGIDVSNPGKSAAKWAKKGIYDTDYNGDGTYEDDEGHGGGSAISKQPVVNPEPSE